MLFNKDKLFCDINPFCYAISEKKETLKRFIHNKTDGTPFATVLSDDRLDNVVFEHHSHLIKRAPGVDLTLQYNKAVNIELACKTMNGLVIKPGESFSFWERIGKPTEKKGYKPGRVLIRNRIYPGIGGGLCNLANTIHYVAFHSPLEVTEFHNHSDALAPDEGKRVPFSAGTSVSYNYIDFRFKNNSEQNVQLCVWCSEENLYAQLRSEYPFPFDYRMVEEEHHFKKEGEKYYRNSKIYKDTVDRENGNILEHRLYYKNHSQVMFDYELIPKELVK